MIIFGTGGLSDIMTPEQEEEFKELLALKWQQMCEEAGWGSSFGRDPILILISLQEQDEDNPERED